MGLDALYQPNQDAAPAQDMSADVPDQIQSPPDQPASQPSQPAPQANKTSAFRNILQGALKGLAMGGIPGAVEGGIDPNGARTAFQQRQQLAQDKVAMANSRVKFSDAQAASAVAQASVEQFHLQHLSEEWNTAQDAAAVQQVQSFGNMGIKPLMVTEADPRAAQAALEQITASRGAVPQIVALHVGNKIVAYDINDIASGNQIPPIIAQVQPLANTPEITQAAWAKMNPAQRAKATQDAMSFFSPIPDPRTVDKQIAQYKNLRLTYGIAHSTDPDVTDNLKKFDGVISSLTAARDEWDKRVADHKEAGAKATAKGRAEGTPAKPAKEPPVGNMLVGSLQDGSQVAGTQDELTQAGATGLTKLPAADASKVVVSRQLVSPGGLFSAVAADIKNLEAKGKIGDVASRWNDFLAGKVGNEPDFAALRTDMGLLGTALMQAHVGAKGSDAMMEHFKSLADYRISDGPTLKSALSREFAYVHHKAMLAPKGGK